MNVIALVVDLKKICDMFNSIKLYDKKKKANWELMLLSIWTNMRKTSKSLGGLGWQSKERCQQHTMITFVNADGKFGGARR